MRTFVFAAFAVAASLYFTDRAFAGKGAHATHLVEHKVVQTVPPVVQPAAVAAPVVAPTLVQPMTQVLAAPAYAAPVVQQVVQPMVQQVVQPMVQPVVQQVVQPVAQPVAAAVSLPAFALERPAAVTVHGLFSIPPTVYVGARVAVPVAIQGAVVVPAPSW